MSEVNTWIKEELKDINVGDKRLDSRTLKIALSMANAPSLPLNQVTDDWLYKTSKNKKPR